MFDFEKFPLIQDVAELEKASLAVIKSYAKMREKTHQVVVSHVCHAIKAGSADRLSNFWNALPLNANKRGISLWVRRYTTLDYGLTKDKQLRFKGVPAWRDEQGKNIPFYSMPEVKKDSEIIPAPKLLELLLAKLSKRLKDKKLSADELDLYTSVDKAFAGWQKRHFPAKA